MFKAHAKRVRQRRAFTPKGAPAEAATIITQALRQPLGGAGRLALFAKDNTIPKAYLNYLFFDKDMNYKAGGFKQVSEEGLGRFEELSLEFAPEEEGLLMVYTANQTAEDLDVYFDQMTVAHTSGPIVRVDDYYPFGMTFNTGELAGALTNKYLFNGKEHQPELGWDDFGARMYMSDIGRWGVIDPMADRFPRFTPYNYAVNNPVLFIDPDGQSPLNIVNAQGMITRAFAHLMHLSTGISKQTVFNTTIEFDSQNPIHPHKNLTGYSRGAITLYNHIIFTDNYDTPQGRTLAESRGYVQQWFNILPHELGHRVQSDAKALYLTTYIGQALWTMAKEGSVNSNIIHDKILMEQEAEKYQKDFNDFIQFFNYTDDKGRNRNRIVDLFGGGVKDQDYMIGQLDKYYDEYQKAKEEENKKKSEGASQLLNDASSGNLEEGTYKWNGSKWVKQ